MGFCFAETSPRGVSPVQFVSSRCFGAGQEVAGWFFESFGSHCRYEIPYCAFACALGEFRKHSQIFCSGVEQGLACKLQDTRREILVFPTQVRERKNSNSF